MKYSIVTVIFLCFLSTTIFSQGNKGRITLSGGVSYESMTSKTDPASGESITTNLSLIPAVGYYITDAVKVGLAIDYSLRATETKPLTGTSSKTTNTLFVINPFVNFYIPASEHIDLYLQGNFGYGTGSWETTPAGSKGDVSQISFWVTPGLEYMISQRIALDLSVGTIGYFSTTRTPSGVTSPVKSIDNSLNFSINLSSVKLGVIVFL